MSMFLALAIGAICGASLRWGLGTYFNPFFPTLPLGTLIANLLGAFIIGVFVALFEKFPFAPASLRIGIITGFLGSLTTFSTFSAETVHLLITQSYGWGAILISAHLFGSILMTMVGIFTVKFIAGI